MVYGKFEPCNVGITEKEKVKKGGNERLPL